MPPSLCPATNNAPGATSARVRRYASAACPSSRYRSNVVLASMGVLLPPTAALSNRKTIIPCDASASASSFALPFFDGSSGLFQSRSVGPLPAISTTAAYGPLPLAGFTSVPGTAFPPDVNETSSLAVASLPFTSTGTARLSCFAAGSLAGFVAPPPPQLATHAIAATSTAETPPARQLTSRSPQAPQALQALR